MPSKKTGKDCRERYITGFLGTPIIKKWFSDKNIPLYVPYILLKKNFNSSLLLSYDRLFHEIQGIIATKKTELKELLESRYNIKNLKETNLLRLIVAYELLSKDKLISELLSSQTADVVLKGRKSLNELFYVSYFNRKRISTLDIFESLERCAKVKNNQEGREENMEFRLFLEKLNQICFSRNYIFSLRKLRQTLLDNAKELNGNIAVNFIACIMDNLNIEDICKKDILKIGTLSKSVLNDITIGNETKCCIGCGMDEDWTIGPYFADTNTILFEIWIGNKREGLIISFISKTGEEDALLVNSIECTERLNNFPDIEYAIIDFLTYFKKRFFFDKVLINYLDYQQILRKLRNRISSYKSMSVSKTHTVPFDIYTDCFDKKGDYKTIKKFMIL